MMISKRHQRLRTATRAGHQRLEDTPVMQALSDPRLDETSYVSAIAALYEFWRQHLPEADPATERLRSDLNSLSVDPDALPRMPQRLVVPLQNSIDRMARDYLLLGSSLGGTVICRRMAAQFGQPWVNAHASHFLAAEQSGTSAWRLYLECLADAELTEPEEDRLVEVACKLFATLHEWAIQMPAVQLDTPVRTTEHPA